VCNLIKDNEIDHLRELLETFSPARLAKIRWSENEEVVVNGVKVCQLSPLALAVKSKSLACIKLIVSENYISKELYQYGSYEVDGKTYSTLLLPLLLLTKDLEALNYLTKQASLSLKTKDLHNFIEQAIRDKWVQGAKALLTSVPALLAYQALEYQGQHQFMEGIFTLVQSIEDLKLRRIYSLALVEDVLTKRPFSKVLALTLLNLTSDLRTQGS
jgi:hypothetical protein